MGGLSKKSKSIKLKMQRMRRAKLRELKRVYKKLTAAERAAIAHKAHRIAPLSNTETYLKND